MKSTTEPFKVTCELLDGRVHSADGLFFLDAILYHAWFLKHDPDVMLGLSPKVNAKFFGLPLRQLDNNRYAASMGFYKNHGLSIEYWNKRPRWDKRSEYLDAKGKINVSAGQFRAYRTPCIIRNIEKIEFYGYGTIEKVIDLLSHIKAVGKKPAAGWGAVKNWIVEPWPEDWSIWSEKYGLMRPMPIAEPFDKDLSKYQVRDIAIRPPAWKVNNQDTCYIPNYIYETEI